MSFVPRQRDVMRLVIGFSPGSASDFVAGLLLPELPALAECGLPEYEVTNWLGIVAPPGTPPDVLDSLNTEIGAALAADGVGDALRRSGMERCGGSRADFSVHLARELARWKPVVSRFTSRRSGQRVQREEAE